MADTKTRKRVATTNVDEHKISIFGPPDEDGEQGIAHVFHPTVKAWPEDMLHKMAVYGFAQIASNIYNRVDDQSPDNVLALIQKLHDTVSDGTWTPGRNVSTGEPDDIVLAIAEATGMPVHVVQNDIEERVALDEHGQPIKDARGRTKRVFTKAVLKAMERDPQIAPILARLAAERAKVAKKDGATTGGLDLFKQHSRHVSAAAN